MNKKEKADYAIFGELRTTVTMMGTTLDDAMKRYARDYAGYKILQINGERLIGMCAACKFPVLDNGQTFGSIDCFERGWACLCSRCFSNIRPVVGAELRDP